MLCRQQPAVAGDDLAIIGDQERRGEAVLDQRGGDPGDLIVRMRARVVRVRLQARERHQLDLLGAEAKGGHQLSLRRHRDTGLAVTIGGSGTICLVTTARPVN